MIDNEKRRKAIMALDDCDGCGAALPHMLVEALTGSQFDKHEAYEALIELIEPQLPDGVEWPRFEDGEPVRIGDEIEAGIIEHYAITVGEVIFNDSKRYIRDTESVIHKVIGPIKRPDPTDTWDRILADADNIKNLIDIRSYIDDHDLMHIVEETRDYMSVVAARHIIARCKALAEKEAGR